MADAETKGKPGRKTGQRFANVPDVVKAAMEGTLMKLSDEKSISYNAASEAAQQFAMFAKPVPKDLQILIDSKTPTSIKADPNKIGDTIQRIISVNRGNSPVLFQVPLDAYKNVKDQDHCWISFEKDSVVITFKKPK